MFILPPPPPSVLIFPVGRAFFKDFSVEGQLRKGTQGKKGKVEKYSLLGGVGVLSQKMFVFLSSLDLISCNFSMIFAHFQTKRDITRGGGGQNPLVRGGGQHRGWGALAPPVYMLKKAVPVGGNARRQPTTFSRALTDSPHEWAARESNPRSQR